MAIKTGDVVKKSEVVSYFNENVINYIYSGTPWHSGNVPKITSKQDGKTKDAIPAGQFDDNTKKTLAATSIPTEVMTASEVVTACVNLIKELSRIRKATYIYYHSVNGTDEQQATATNKAIFKGSTPAISGDTRPYYTKSPNTKNMKQTITVADANVKSGQVISAANIINFFNNCKNAWSTAYNNTVTYKYYTCHDQCHSNCYDRARR